MTQKEDLLSQEPAMNALSVSEVITPNMPVDIAAQEATEQHSVSLTYQNELATAGVTLDTIALLLTRSNALREAQAQWRITYNSHQESIKKWDEQSPLGYALKKELNSTFRFAYRDDSFIIAKVREVGKGTGDDDMIQDLLEYATLGQANPAPLEVVNFDLTKLDTATTLSADLTVLLSQAVNEKKLQHQLKDVRDRSFTIMKTTLDYIRDAGKFVFIDQPEIKKLFTSDYFRKHTAKYAAAAAKSAETPDA